MKTNWALVAGIVAVLSVPFSLAVLEESGRTEAPSAAARLADLAPVEIASPDLDPPSLELPETARPVAAWDSVAAMGLDFYYLAFFDEERIREIEESGRPGPPAQPALTGAFGGAAFGDRSEELAERAPEIARLEERYPDVSVALGFDGGGGGLSRVRLSFPDDGTAHRILSAHWGLPLRLGGGEEPRARAWLDAEGGTRAVLREEPGRAEVDLEPFRPLAEILAPDDRRRLGFERLPLLGATLAEIEEAYAGVLFVPPDSRLAEDSAVYLEIPPHEEAARATRVTFSFNDGRVDAFRFTLDAGLDSGGRDRAMALLARKHGEARPAASGEEPIEFFGPGRRLLVREGALSGALDVTVLPR